jgi:hypothetical protein
MKCAFICVAISLSLPVFGQSLQQSTSDKTLPDSPSATKVLADNTRATPFVSQPLRPAVPALLIQSAPPKEKKRVADRSFILSSLFQIGTTIGDIESTQYGLGHGISRGKPALRQPSFACKAIRHSHPCRRGRRWLELSPEEERPALQTLAHSPCDRRLHARCGAWPQFDGDEGTIGRPREGESESEKGATCCTVASSKYFRVVPHGVDTGTASSHNAPRGRGRGPE